MIHFSEPAITSFTYLQIQMYAWYDQNRRLQEQDLIEPVIKPDVSQFEGCIDRDRQAGKA